MSTASVPEVQDDAAATAQADGDESDVVAELAPRGTDDFSMVGVTWSPGFDATGLKVEVRLRSDGTWGRWDQLDVELDDSESGVPGTEPLWVGTADGVAVRVASPTGERPPGLKVATIDPGTTPAATASTASTAFYSSAASGATTIASSPQPAIILRSQWGAAANSKCDTPNTVGEMRGVIVHHTAGTNNYTAAQSAGIVRATQAYHMKSRKWCDLGYNFLVDKYGQIFEGRNGGIDQQVRAAHSGNAAVNTYAMGVSMMGTYSSVQPTDATKDAMVKLISWRMAKFGTPTTGSYSLGGKTLQRIAGHRDVLSTECPGAAAYAWMSAPGGLRERVSGATSAPAPTSVAQRVAQLGPAKTGAVVQAEYPFYSAPKGTKARYTKIDLISSPRGLFSISDVVRTRYNSLGAQSGAVGVPISIIHTTRRSSVRVQRFEDGSIFRVKRNGKASAFAVYGAIGAKYASLGEADSRLGAPTKTQGKVSGGQQRAWFNKGYITLHSNGRVSVKVK